jgi:hypothetical protein
MTATRITPILMLSFALAGCAATPPGHSLQAVQNDMVRRLAADCYWQREGERVVYGAADIYAACRRWADRQVRVQVPEPVQIRE